MTEREVNGIYSLHRATTEREANGIYSLPRATTEREVKVTATTRCG